MAKDWEIDRAGQMVLCILGWGADVDDGIDSQTLKVSQRGEGQRFHGMPLREVVNL
jgi:hypothetical protein